MLARLFARNVASADLTEWAVQALADGFESPSVVELACATSDSIRLEDADPMFRKALDELGVAMPEREQALRDYLRGLLTKILAGAISPVEGLNRIDYEINLPLQWPPDLQVWSHLAEGYHYPSFREIESAEELERIILNEARKALKRGAWEKARERVWGWFR